MEQRAASSAHFGEIFANIVAENGSAPVVKPLSAFFDRFMAAPDMRKAVKDSLPALMADITHFLNVSHGRLPGVIDHAAGKITDPEARNWLAEATQAFAEERRLLNRLTVAAGPIRRHLDQDKVEALLANQQRSFEMLATSDRNGCPAGSALAFALDWQDTRPLLERTAVLLGLECQSCSLPKSAESFRLAATMAASPAIQRAMVFGAEQMLAQQKGLWQLIAARHYAIMAL